jgi:Tol biopolymer transport system component
MLAHRARRMKIVRVLPQSVLSQKTTVSDIRHHPMWHALAGVALLAAGALACAAPPPRASSTPARSVAPARAEVFSPGVISNAEEQWRITFSPDGRTAYFASSPEFFPFTRRATIYTSRLEGEQWSTPAVAPFSGTHSDIDPFITPDGERLYFSSIRPVNGAPRTDIDLWMVQRTASGWSEPVHLGAEVNSAGDELYPSASSDGSLYFASGPQAPAAGQHYDIYVAARTPTGFAPRKPLGTGVNHTPSTSDTGPQDAWEFNPEVSADGRTLVFTSLRRGGFGLGDLYVSERVGDTWSPARNLGPLVNTSADEYHPTVSRDRGTLYFVRRGPAKGDFYRVATSVLGLR